MSSLWWSRWAELHVSTEASQCRCVPAERPGAEECNPAAQENQTFSPKLFQKDFHVSCCCSFHTEPEGGAHPCFAVDVGLLLQQELHHFDVSVVTGHVQRGVPHLEGSDY